jgi:Fe2+ transport system protein FeoA
MSKSLSELTPGRPGRVTQVNGHGGIRQRLLDMGVLPNVEVEVQRVAPSGSPVWIRLEGSQLALRRAEADAVLVTED